MNKTAKRAGQPTRKLRSNSESDKILLKIPSIDESGDESIEEYEDGSSQFDIIEKQRIGAIVPSSSNYMVKSTIATTPTGAIGAVAVAIVHDEIDPIEEEDDVDIEAIDEDTLGVEQQLKQQQLLRPRSTVDDRQTVQTSGVDSADREESKSKTSGESSLVSKCKKLSLKAKKGKKPSSTAATVTSSDSTAPVSGTGTVPPATPSATAASSTTTATSTSASSSSKSNSNKIGYNNLIASLLRTTTL